MDISTADMERVNTNSLYHTLGIKIETAADGKAISNLKPKEEVCWPFPGQPHGGILFTLMDTTMAWAVLTKIPEVNNCATIHLDIQYTAPAKGAIFTCEAQVKHTTGHLCFVYAVIKDENQQLVAVGQAVFRIIPSAPVF